jgi:hypothetical protein
VSTQSESPAVATVGEQNSNPEPSTRDDTTYQRDFLNALMADVAICQVRLRYQSPEWYLVEAAYHCLFRASQALQLEAGQ